MHIGSVTAMLSTVLYERSGSTATVYSTFLESKLASECSKQRLKFCKYTMLENLRYRPNRADIYTPEIVAEALDHIG